MYIQKTIIEFFTINIWLIVLNSINKKVDYSNKIIVSLVILAEIWLLKL